ncbi:selenide, water dikinase SelD [bacterium]|nr:selenide, water dikinase SelD [bacterium]
MLDRVLPMLPKSTHPDLLIGTSTLDDAGVFRVREDLALVQTVDFFTPIVDDAYDFGRIAAVNSLSDIYAMGGKPITALNILAFPEGNLPEEVMVDILQGSALVCEEAGAAVAGGHSVSDKELKFGLSVTGVIHPDKVIRNNTANAGDRLFLTKPLGTGLLSTAMMNDAADPLHIENAINWMAMLNRDASVLAVKHSVSAMTDVTGFGLLGHLSEMIGSRDISVTLQTSKLPSLDGAFEVAESNSFFSGGERRNLKHVQEILDIASTVPYPLVRLVSDPQTSGGLLIALGESEAESFIDECTNRSIDCWEIGSFTKKREKAIFLL